MRYEYDAQVDILMIYLNKDKPDHGEMNGSIITHYNKKGKAVQLEILDASKTAMEMIQTMLRSKQAAAGHSFHVAEA